MQVHQGRFWNKGKRKAFSLLLLLLMLLTRRNRPYFRVIICLWIKTSLCAKTSLFIWKWFAWSRKTHFQMNGFATDNWGKRQLGNGLYILQIFVTKKYTVNLDMKVICFFFMSHLALSWRRNVWLRDFNLFYFGWWNTFTWPHRISISDMSWFAVWLLYCSRDNATEHNLFLVWSLIIILYYTYIAVVFESGLGVLRQFLVSQASANWLVFFDRTYKGIVWTLLVNHESWSWCEIDLYDNSWTKLTGY